MEIQNHTELSKYIVFTESRQGFSVSHLRLGARLRFEFPNGYGASLIDYGYGAQEGLFEIAVLDSEGCIDYTTPITDDVCGRLDAQQVRDTLQAIMQLPKKV